MELENKIKEKILNLSKQINNLPELNKDNLKFYHNLYLLIEELEIKLNILNSNSNNLYQDLIEEDEENAKIIKELSPVIMLLKLGYNR